MRRARRWVTSLIYLTNVFRWTRNAESHHAKPFCILSFKYEIIQDSVLYSQPAMISFRFSLCSLHNLFFSRSRPNDERLAEYFKPESKLACCGGFTAHGGLSDDHNLPHASAVVPSRTLIRSVLSPSCTSLLPLHFTALIARLQPALQFVTSRSKMTTKRLERVAQHVTGLPLTSKKSLPSFDELPPFKNFSGCAWSVWGPEDQLGTVNLLTEEVVQRAASEEIKYVHTRLGFALAILVSLPAGLRAFTDSLALSCI